MMRILTVRQPWAWAIIHAGKTVENRTRSLGSYRGPVAIHAGLKIEHDVVMPLDAIALADRRPAWYATGAIVGVVELLETHHADLCRDRDGHCSPWAEANRHHLTFAAPRGLTEPLPFAGGLGLRRLDAATEQLVLEGIA